ncbi:thiazolylpeptide-type bacteriocin precursor [Actinomadura pelletieri DSM 43383]|uniref:Thiazolylpeptide-type bacteriocin n=1 Tax=Actinomadura pelletieri DSM 43383 TaxID=1120940 RepID=A0A495QGK1_9ACTN|nr:thiazolylpeptide-type bacteriocin [Actinomadura pelletieri]RKS70994.1 thiazolylpeptide-type bacteriocin precursor [Actinomadura pelletieri DSM 43383]
MNENNTGTISVLREELELLETETFQITDYVEVMDEVAATTSCTSTTSSCSSSSSTSCS